MTYQYQQCNCSDNKMGKLSGDDDEVTGISALRIRLQYMNHRFGNVFLDLPSQGRIIWVFGVHIQVRI